MPSEGLEQVVAGCRLPHYVRNSMSAVESELAAALNTLLH